MQITLLLFAHIREKIGLPRLTVDLPDGSTIADLQVQLILRYPNAAPILSVCRFSVNAEYGDPQSTLSEGTEVGVIPPVSGGAQPLCRPHARISRDPIRMDSLAERLTGEDAGAVLTFAGTVRRDQGTGRHVTGILYEGHEPMARQVLEKIAGRVADRHGVRVAVEHRLGELPVGDISVGIAVSAPHREAGFSALREMIESIKTDLPVWKKEQFSDGTSEWVSCSARP